MNTKQKIVTYLLYATLALSLTIVHHFKIDVTQINNQVCLHLGILKNTAPQPYNLRVLQPWLVEGATKIAAVVNIDYFTAFVLGYGTIRFISLFATFCLADALFTVFGGVLFAKLAVLFLAAIYPLSFLFYYYQPTSILDLAFLTLGVLLIVKNKNLLLLAAVMLFAALNRNTSIFILVFYALWNFDTFVAAMKAKDKPKITAYIAGCVILLVVWADIMYFLNLSYPSKTWSDTPASCIAYNLTHPRAWIVSALILWPVIASFIFAWKQLSFKYKMLAAWCAVYLALHLVMGRADEVRLFLPLYIASAPVLAVALKKLKFEDAAA